MPREAKLFAASAGSAVRGFLKFRANIPPRWIGNARTSRKRVEPEIAAAFQSFMRLTKNRPRGTSRHSERAEGIARSLETLGNCLPQGEFLSRHSRSPGATTERLFKLMGRWAEALGCS